MPAPTANHHLLYRLCMPNGGALTSALLGGRLPAHAPPDASAPCTSDSRAHGAARDGVAGTDPSRRAARR